MPSQLDVAFAGAARVDYQLVDSVDGQHGVEERARLRALARYAILDTPADQGFDDLAELARTIAGTPVAGIGFFDVDRVWFKSLLGGAGRAYTREQLFVAQNAATAPTSATDVEPGRTDADLRSFPCVTPDGFTLGCIFVAQDGPLALDAEQLASLAALARQVVRLLELRRTVLSYHTIVDGAGAVVFHLDQADRLVSLTPTWSKLSGFGVVRSVGARLEDFLSSSERDAFGAWLAQVRSEPVPPLAQYRLRRLAGDEVMVEVLARPLVDEGGRVLGVVGVMVDVTERYAQEVETQHRQRLEALGRLSAGLAHEINTPIQFVGDNTRFLAEAYSPILTLVRGYRAMLDPEAESAPWAERHAQIQRLEAVADIEYLAREVPSAIQQSLDGVERVASLVRAMKTFSHPGTDAQSPADLNDALRATVTVARNQFRYIAEARLELGELPPVTCSIADLNQVFLNVVVNAADAIEEKGEPGTITVITRQDGTDALIAVTDTGAGVPERLQRQIFEPFFTTKQVGRGTGQGLALVRAVVDRHGGRVSVHSTPGLGTTFTIRIPIHGNPEHHGDPEHHGGSS
ncbi:MULTISPECIES: sensor histidine kinase [Nocardioides]|uniref:histidine kinase n=1 Tax=Nocardioides vastitatis TaxID=2568655 RepID=A0ABW0ZM41_9ACTN|nr:ATP-binding protein [Nocardioides sp.]THJ08752.1 PAS domain S-box protein [Nocardioides sp.]